jgi:Zn-dependent protease
MLIGEPPPTAADLHFRLFGIPVRVHPFFWLVSLLLASGGKEVDPASALVWVGAVFVSILVHELGHAFAARAHGWAPWITLYGMGGLALYRPTYHSARSSIAISAAGPAAGFLFAGVVVAAVLAAGHRVSLQWDLIPIRFEGFDNAGLNALVSALLVINIYWGIINLFPVYPLDGGRISRELLMSVNATRGTAWSLWVSTACAAALAAWALSERSYFMAFMFGYLSYASFATLQAYSDGGGGRRW